MSCCRCRTHHQIVLPHFPQYALHLPSHYEFLFNFSFIYKEIISPAHTSYLLSSSYFLGLKNHSLPNSTTSDFLSTFASIPLTCVVGLPIFLLKSHAMPPLIPQIASPRRRKELDDADKLL
jgi:hypothetical protein